MLLILRIILVLAVLAVVEYYFLRISRKSVRTVLPWISKKLYKRIAAVILIFFNLYPFFLLISVFTRGTSLVPENKFIDYLLIFPFWTFMLIAVQSILIIILMNVIKLIILPYYRRNKIHWYKTEQRIVFILIAFFVLYVPARILYDYYTVEVRKVIYYKKGLNESLKDFTLVLIADTQADRYTNTERLGKFISLVNAQKPDLVLVAGDVITSSPTYINLAAEYLGKIKATYGVFACRGDHDHWAYHGDTPRSIREITEALDRRNVKMISNLNQEFNIKGARVEVTFITNTYVERTPVRILENIVNTNKKDLKILLSHQPGRDAIDLASARNYDLFLAGHTHGGQITFLFPFKNLTPTLFETGLVKGDFHFGNMLLIINRGLGMSLVPIRYNSTPEITVINFSPN